MAEEEPGSTLPSSGPVASMLKWDKQTDFDVFWKRVLYPLKQVT